MRSLTRSDGRLPKWLVTLRRKSNAICTLLYVAGVVYLAGIVWPAFNDRTYFSENALLPGLVDDEFIHRERTNTFAKQLRQVVQSRYEQRCVSSLVSELRNLWSQVWNATRLVAGSAPVDRTRGLRAELLHLVAGHDRSESYCSCTLSTETCLGGEWYECVRCDASRSSAFCRVDRRRRSLPNKHTRFHRLDLITRFVLQRCAFPRVS
jgi:hypothetical protein